MQVGVRGVAVVSPFVRTTHARTHALAATPTLQCVPPVRANSMRAMTTPCDATPAGRPRAVADLRVRKVWAPHRPVATLRIHWLINGIINQVVWFGETVYQDEATAPSLCR